MTHWTQPRALWLLTQHNMVCSQPARLRQSPSLLVYDSGSRPQREKIGARPKVYQWVIVCFNNFVSAKQLGYKSMHKGTFKARICVYNNSHDYSRSTRKDKNKKQCKKILKQNKRLKRKYHFKVKKHYLFVASARRNDGLRGSYSDRKVADQHLISQWNITA